LTRSNPLFRLVAVLFAAALVLGACGGGDEDSPNSAAETTEGTDAGGGGEAEDEGEGGGGGECGGSGGETVDVEAANFAFKPNKISAPAGDQVTVNFTNSDDTPHTFTITDMSCDTSAVGGGASAELSFTMPDAETEWICSIHPDMKGTLSPE
jgi:plastocyanin